MNLSQEQLLKEPIPDTWYKKINDMTDADLYNFLIKPFKKSKAGLKILVRQRLAEYGKDLKFFKKLTNIAFTKAPLKALLIFFEDHGGLFIPDIPSPPKSKYIGNKDIRSKFQLNKIAIEEAKEKNAQEDTSYFNDLYDKLENTKVYDDDEQKAFIQKLKKSNTIKSIGISFKKQKIENVTLGAHQINFMNHFLYNDVPGAIMFHGVGTGKTLTAVGLSNMYLMIYPYNKVTIASPPALLDNFVSSLIQFGLDIRDNRYTFTTYEKLLKMSNKDMDKTLLLIDEAHNFRTHIISHISKNEAGDVEEKPSQNKRGYILMTKFAANCHKICLMTGTAFVNELYDIENLLTMVNHRSIAHDKNDFNKIIADDPVRRDYFKYKVSHYTNPPNNKFFPDFIDQLVPVIRTAEETQDYDNEYNEIVEEYEGKDPFYIVDRRLSNTFKNKNGVNPKIQKVIDIITEQDMETIEKHKNKDISEIIFNKSIIYTGFIQSGVQQLKEQFKKLHINFTVISGDVNTSEKIAARRSYNLYGKTGDIVSDNETLPRILIITKAGTEGVDTQWTKNIFLLDGCWNEAANEQIIARAIRFQSHYDPTNPNKRSLVLVHRMLYINESKGSDEGGTMDEEKLVKKLNIALTKKTIYNLGGFDFKGTMEKLIEDKKLLKDTESAKYGGISTERKFDSYANKLKSVLTKNQAAKQEINDAIDKIKFQSDTDMQKIKNSVWDKYKNKFKVASVKHLPKDIQAELQKEINELKTEYWRTRGKNFGGSTTVSNIVAVLNSGKVSNELFLYLLSNAKQQVIVDFLYELDHHIKQLEQLEINKESVKIIDKIIDENYKLKRPMTDEEKNKIVTTIRKNGMEQTATNLLNENYSKSEVSRIDKILHTIQLKQNKAQEKKIEKSLQEYFTPADVAIRMINFSNLHTYKNKKINILEPTAGEGGLVGPILKFCADNSINIGTFDCCEFSKPNRDELKKLFSQHSYLNISETPDFFNYTTDTRYDFIFMNPPYNLVQSQFGASRHIVDLDFVLRAYQLLNKGGQLISLVYGPHIEGTNAKLVNHMNILKQLKYTSQSFSMEWNSSQNKGEKEIKIKSLPLAIIHLKADQNIEYTPIVPLDVKINKEDPFKNDVPKINIVNENLESINELVNRLVDDDKPITKKKKKITLDDLI